MSVTIEDNAKAIRKAINDLSNGLSSTPVSADGTPKTLKILVIANSHGQDCWGYVPFILKEYGISIKLGLFYVRGQSIGGHTNHYSDGEDWASGDNVPRLHYIDTERGDTAWSVASDDQGLIMSHKTAQTKRRYSALSNSLIGILLLSTKVIPQVLPAIIMQAWVVWWILFEQI